MNINSDLFKNLNKDPIYNLDNFIKNIDSILLNNLQQQKVPLNTNTNTNKSEDNISKIFENIFCVPQVPQTTVKKQNIFSEKKQSEDKKESNEEVIKNIFELLFGKNDKVSNIFNNLSDFKVKVATCDSLDSFKNIVEDVMGQFDNKTSSFSLLYDLIDNDDKYQVIVEIPGINKENISIDLDVEKGLEIKAEKKINDDVKFLIKNIKSQGIYSCFVELPKDVDISKTIKAEYDNGLLNITLDKKNKPEKNTIKINIV